MDSKALIGAGVLVIGTAMIIGAINGTWKAAWDALFKKGGGGSGGNSATPGPKQADARRDPAYPPPGSPGIPGVAYNPGSRGAGV